MLEVPIQYKGSVPWAGVGNSVRGAKNTAEMLKMSGLDWTVSKRPLWTAPAGWVKGTSLAALLKVPGEMAVVRDKDDIVSGVVSEKYRLRQNIDTLELFSQMCEMIGLQPEVAGELDYGQWIWVLTRIGDEVIRPTLDDPIFPFILFAYPHVPSYPQPMISAVFIRPVTWTSIIIDISKLCNVQALRRSESRAVRKAVAQEARYVIESMTPNLSVVIGNLARAKIVNRQDIVLYLTKLFQPTFMRTGVPDIYTLSRSADQAYINYTMGLGSRLDSAKSTWWGAYCAVNYYADYQYGDMPDMPRLSYAWTYKGSLDLKQKAWKLAIEMAKNGENFD